MKYALNNRGKRCLDSIEESKYDLPQIFKAIIFLYIASTIIQIIRLWLMNIVSKQIDLELSMKYYTHLIHLPMKSILKRKTGEYLSRFNDSILIRDALSNVIITFFFDVIMTVGGGIILYSLDRTLFLVCLIMLIAYAAIVLLYRKPLSNINRLSMEQNAATEAFLKESIDGVETLKLNNAEEYAVHRTKDKFISLLNYGMCQNIYANSQEIITNAVEMIGMVSVIWIGIQFILSGNLTIGELVGFYMLMGYFMTPFKDIIQLQHQIQ